jgi:basic membrane protein A
MTTTCRAIAAVAAVGLLLTGCVAAPDEEAPAGSGEATGGAATATPTGDLTGQATVAPVDYTACQITATSGLVDPSLDQAAQAGLSQAEAELGIDTTVLTSPSQADSGRDVHRFSDEGCDLIITVGPGFGEATAAAAADYPDTDFLIVDDSYDRIEDRTDGGADNLRTVVFATDQAAFLAGYAAAGMTDSGTVGIYGGTSTSSVTRVMDGFLAGVQYHNQEQDTHVELLGWDGERGFFTGDFTDRDKGRRTTHALLEAGADIVMPVAGPVGVGSAIAMEQAGRGTLIWVGTDGVTTVEAYRHRMLTSVVKEARGIVVDTIQQAIDGGFPDGLHEATLANGGVRLAPFHDLEGEVPSELEDDLAGIRQGIIDGEIPVAPAADDA